MSAALLAAAPVTFAQNATPAADDLDDVVVTALRQRVAVSKFDVELLDLPASVDFVTAADLERLAVTRVEDVANFVAGVSAALPRGGALSTGFFVRGFQNTPLLVDGFYNGFGGGFQEGVFDVALAEQIEVLKGPSAVLYGQGNPGGVINMSLKRPQQQFGGSVDLSGDEHGFRRASVDVTGALGSEKFSGRLVVVGEDSESFRDFVENRRVLVAPMLTWKPTDRVTLDALYVQDEYEFRYDRGFGFSGDALQYDPPPERFYGEPWMPLSKVRTEFGQLRADVQLTDDLLLRALYVDQSQTRGGNVDIGTLFTDGPGERLSSRYYEVRTGSDNNRSDERSVTLQLRGSVETAGAGHQFVLEATQFEPETRSQYRDGDPGPIDLVDPVYSDGPVTEAGPPSDVFFSDAEVRSIALQDLISLGDRWRLLLGVRHDRVENRSGVELLAGGVSDLTQVDTKTTARVGVVYRASESTSYFVNAGSSFLPQVGQDRFGNPLDPEEGTSYEIGFKSELLDRRVALTGTVFQIEKKNILTIDTVDIDFNISAGEARSRGAELEMEWALDAATRLKAGASYLDTEITRSNDLPIGDRLPGAPEFSAVVYGEREIPLGSRTLVLSGLATYLGETAWRLPNRPAGTYDGVPTLLPSYVRLDLGAEMSFGALTARLNLKNVLDEEIYVGNGYGLVGPGQPRTVYVALGYRFGAR